MGRAKKVPFKNYEGKEFEEFVRITKSMLNNKNFLSLNGGAVKLYLILKIRNHSKVEFYCSHKQLEQYLPHSTVERALKELIKKGFLEVTSKGCFSNSTANTYRFSDKWKYL